MRTRALLVPLIAALALPGAALGKEYPPPKDPGAVKGHPKGKLTLRVCKRGKTGKYRYRSMQKAVDFAGRGDTIRVCDGVYRAPVRIEGRRKAGLRLIGNVRHPRRVVIDLKGLRGAKAQDGVRINGADGVTVRGFYARHYKGNGFFAVNVTGYTLSDLVAGYGGTYGVYAFNSKGGRMERDEAFYNNDSGFYIGQTPPQTRPKPSLVRRVKAWGNVIGYSGTNSRYVTLTKSQWFNNGIGIVPNALTSERFYPPEDNTIVDNDIFWNNFNYFRGAPFRLRPGSAGDLAYPVGTGVLLFGGRRDVVTNNRIYGNYLAGAGMVQQVLMVGDTSQDPKLRARIRKAGVIVGNEIRGNRYGAGGADLNGHDVFYDGSGRDNCVQETGALTAPIGSSAFRPCPFAGANSPDSNAFGTILGWATAPSAKRPASYEQFWRAKGHPAKPGFVPLERCVKTKTGCRGQPKR